MFQDGTNISPSGSNSTTDDGYYTSILELDPVAMEDATDYTCRFTYTGTTATSNIATVSVIGEIV